MIYIYIWYIYICIWYICIWYIYIYICIYIYDIDIYYMYIYIYHICIYDIYLHIYIYMWYIYIYYDIKPLVIKNMATENAQFLDVPIKTYIYRQGSSHCRNQLDMIWGCLTIGRAKNTMEIHQRGWQNFGVWPVWLAFWVNKHIKKKHLFPANILAHLSFQCWTKSVPCFRQHLRICGICRAFDAETIWGLSQNLLVNCHSS